MPTYHYTARDAVGKAITGKRLAQSADSLSAELQKEGLSPISIHFVEDSREGILKILFNKCRKPVTLEALSLFARQMYTLTKAGVPVTLALKQLAQTSHSSRFVFVLYNMVEHLESGRDLASAMTNNPDIFTPIMVNMVRVGQNAGRLDQAFLFLNQYLELEASALKRIKATMHYPLIVISMLIAAIFFINIFVVPAFAKLFEQANVQLPLATRLLISFSLFFTEDWPLLLIFLGAFITVSYLYLISEKGKLAWHRYQLQIPLIGSIIRRIILLRFAQAFSITIRSGIPILSGLDLVSQAINNVYAQQEIQTMRDYINRGKNITQAAANSQLFTPLELQMLSVSEETGGIAEMLDEIASFYRREIEYDLKRLNDWVEPILMISLAIFVLILALAVYLPIWNMVKFVQH